MALSRSRRRDGADYWPGFVDALSTLVIGIVFLLSVFVLAQFFLSQEITGKDTALRRLENQVAELTDLLAQEKTQKRSVEENLALLQSTLSRSDNDRARLQGLLDGGAGAAGGGDVERRLEDGGNLLHILDEPGVLDDRHRDSRDVALLERVGADQRRAHLARDADERRGVHPRIRDRRHEVRRTGAGGGDGDTGAA